MFSVLKIFYEFPANDAIIAPTIITDDIALVTDINGVCSEGVTLHTTKYPTKMDSIKMLNLKIKGSISINYLTKVFLIISSSRLILIFLLSLS